MRKKHPLESKLEKLQNGGKPFMVSTRVQRINCHNIAGKLGMKIATRNSLTSVGFEIHLGK